MTDNRANIKVSREFYDEHNERRQKVGQTWEEYIDGQAPELEETIRRVLHEELDRDE